jgi:hypothetical protein
MITNAIAKLKRRAVCHSVASADRARDGSLRGATAED